MPVRLEDLPPAMRRHAEAALDVKPKRSPAGDSRVATDGVCWPCGERYSSVAAWEKHSAATGHRRFELVQTREVES